jgi:hypothetical protein
MNKINVFDAEREAGIEEQIRSQASLAYVSQLCPAAPAAKSKNAFKPLNKNLLKDIKAIAGQKDKDVFRTFSILVSTSWNKNDDVFSQDEVWAAKETPTYKPANLEHDEKKIVGGIIGTWPVDDEYNLIDPNVSLDELPEVYHLLVSSVIYNQWQDPEYKSRAEELIKKIEDGQMFVSMECVFSGFDYAVVAPNDDNHIVARTNDTAFLSRHLRAYGGTGEFQGHKVGRLLKNITFSGKGFVEKPANPDSIIFDRETAFDFTNASIAKNLFSYDNGVSVRVGNDEFSETNSQENLDMSNDILNDQIQELKEALAAVKAENKELNAQVAEANVGKWETQVAEMKEQVETISNDLSTASEDLTTAKTKIEELEETLASESEARSKAEDLVKTMEDEKTQAGRTAQLIEAGLSEEEALAKIEVFADLSDEQFEALAEAITVAKPFRAEVKKDEEEDKEKADPKKIKADPKKIKAEEASEEESVEEAEAEEAEVVDEEVLETASVEEAIDMTVASEETEDGIQHVRANLRDWVNSYVLKTEQGESE